MKTNGRRLSASRRAVPLVDAPAANLATAKLNANANNMIRSSDAISSQIDNLVNANLLLQNALKSLFSVNRATGYSHDRVPSTLALI